MVVLPAGGVITLQLRQGRMLCLARPAPYSGFPACSTGALTALQTPIPISGPQTDSHTHTHTHSPPREASSTSPGSRG